MKKVKKTALAANGRFVLRFLEPIEPSASPTDDSVTLHALWATIEGALLGGRLGDWEMWLEFDRMQPATMAGSVSA